MANKKDKKKPKTEREATLFVAPVRTQDITAQDHHRGTINSTVHPALDQANDLLSASPSPSETVIGPTVPQASSKKRRKKGDGSPEADADDPAEVGKTKQIGTSKAVETMFRNAIRTELDLIQLAATKANIMISLNGFIISALMISGALLFNSSAGFLLPAAVFMVTAAASIVFALLAASPERVNLFGALQDWIGAVRRREAGLRDLRRFVMRGGEQSPGDEPNILIYDDRARMTPEDYWDRMQELLRNREDVYRKMSDQLYWLGQMANRKFKLLNISYMVFRWGLLASVLAFLVVKSAFWAFPALRGDAPAPIGNLGISSFENVFEPSAVQQLPDGRILVVEDEAKRAMSLMSFADDGTLVEDQALNLRLLRGFGRKMNDLEGLSLDDRGNIYAITSHSVGGKGERDPDREQLLRFQISGSSVGGIRNVTDLRDLLTGSPALVKAIAAEVGETVDFKDLNIEGLSWHGPTGRLLLGLREPKAGDRSIILPIENPDEMFEKRAAVSFGTPILLDLKGGGIRALSYDPVLGEFIIVNEIKETSGRRISQIWTWSGRPEDPPRPLDLPSIINLDNVESVDSVTVRGEERLLIMSDEGDAKKGVPARYMMLDYRQLGR